MESSLLKKFLLGDKQQISRAISMLYDELAKKFLGHLYKRGIGDSDAEDIIQSVFLKIAEKPQLIANADEIHPYIWRMFFNACNEFYRDKQSSREDAIESEQLEQMMGSYADSDILLENCMGEAMSALRRRSYDEALAIELSTINGWALKDVAVFLDKTYGAAREYISQARRKLQELVIKYCGEDVMLDLESIN